MGLGPESHGIFKCVYQNDSNVMDVSNNTGIYFSETDKQNEYRKFCAMSDECIRKSSALACFVNTHLDNIQKFYIEKYGISGIHSRSLEPYYVLSGPSRPWTHELLGLRVLIISPFVDSFKKPFCSLICCW